MNLDYDQFLTSSPAHASFCPGYEPGAYSDGLSYSTSWKKQRNEEMPLPMLSPIQSVSEEAVTRNNTL